jgi:hypothetical protein
MVETFFKRSCTIPWSTAGPIGRAHRSARRSLGSPRLFSRPTADSSSGSSSISTVGWSRRASVQSNSMKTSSSAIAAGSGAESTYGLKMYARLLDLLREQRTTPRCTTKAVPTARETLLEKYRCYLLDERGLAQGSVRNMLLYVDRFLVEKYPRDHFDFAALKPVHITTFVRRQATELGWIQAKHVVYGPPWPFQIPPASRRDRYGSRRLRSSRSRLFVLHGA